MRDQVRIVAFVTYSGPFSKMFFSEPYLHHGIISYCVNFDNLHKSKQTLYLRLMPTDENGIATNLHVERVLLKL